MRYETLMECAKILNTVDINDPKNQKAISVSESYILHSYDLYKKNCIREGYEPLSQENYMLEILNLNEGILKKVLAGAAIAGTAYAAAKGVNYVNQQAKYNTQNTDENGMGKNNYQAGGGLTGFWNNTKAAFNQAGGVRNFAGNAMRTGFGRVGQEQVAKGGMVGGKTTDAEGNEVDNTEYRVGSKKDARKAIKKQDKDQEKSQNGAPSTGSAPAVSNGTTSTTNANTQGTSQNTNTQGNADNQNGQGTAAEQKGVVGTFVHGAVDGIKNAASDASTVNQNKKKEKQLKKEDAAMSDSQVETLALRYLQSNPSIDASTIESPRVRAEVEKRQAAMAKNNGNSTAPLQGPAVPPGFQRGSNNNPKKVEVPTEYANKGFTSAQYENLKKYEAQAKQGTLTQPADIQMYNNLLAQAGQPAYTKPTPQTTATTAQTGQTTTQATSSAPIKYTTNRQLKNTEQAFVQSISAKIGNGQLQVQPGQIYEYGKYKVQIDNNGKPKIMREDYWWFENIPISNRKSFLEEQNIFANEYFVCHGVKYKVNEFGNNWNRVNESKIFLEYLDLNNDDEIIAFAKSKHNKIDYESGTIDDIDFLKEAYNWDLISNDEFIDLMEDYSKADYFYNIIDYICENWYDAKSLREPLTPSMRMPAGYKY